MIAWQEVERTTGRAPALTDQEAELAGVGQVSTPRFASSNYCRRDLMMPTSVAMNQAKCKISFRSPSKKSRKYIGFSNPKRFLYL